MTEAEALAEAAPKAPRRVDVVAWGTPIAYKRWPRRRPRPAPRRFGVLDAWVTTVA